MNKQKKVKQAQHTYISPSQTRKLGRIPRNATLVRGAKVYGSQGNQHGDLSLRQRKYRRDY